MKVVTVLGARPQFIKAAVVSRLLRTEHEEIIIHTGQHYDRNMSEIFFEELDIPRPDYNLEIGSATHGKQTGKMLDSIEEILYQTSPDMVLVYGDTNSTLAGSLAASKLNIPISHVEAGLRSFNRMMPEEQNRIVTDHLSSLLLCPTQQAVDNLAKEGLVSRCIKSGDVMFDAMLHYLKKQKANVLGRLGVEPGKYVLFTLHRAENTIKSVNLVEILERIAQKKIPVVFPIHPRTAKLLQNNERIARLLDRIVLVPPVSYLEMIALELQSLCIITDSGGVQKEAYFLKRPCITLREQTEWTETLHGDCNQLTGLDPVKIEIALERVLSDAFINKLIFTDHYGEGNAAEIIVATMANFPR